MSAMSGWFEHLLPPKEEAPADTSDLTGTFLSMDKALSEVQTQVETYHQVAHDPGLDTSWDAVLTRCEEATNCYLLLTEPGAHPRQDQVDRGCELVLSAIKGLTAFRSHYCDCLLQAANQVAKLAAEAQRAQEEAARRAAELPGKVTQTLSSVSSRLQAARTRLNEVQPALSTLFREFVISCSADLVDHPAKAQDHINTASECLCKAQTAQHTGQYQEALDLAQQARTELTAADHLIDAAPQRLRVLRETRDNPQERAKKVRFALHDAQMFCVNHGLTREWGSVLDAQLARINAAENKLKDRNPDYLAYTNALESVSDFIQGVVAKMRAGLRK